MPCTFGACGGRSDSAAVTAVWLVLATLMLAAICVAALCTHGTPDDDEELAYATDETQTDAPLLQHPC